MSTDAGPQAPTSPVPGRQLWVPVHGELFRATRASVASSTAAVPAPGTGSADIVLAGWRRVPTTGLAEPAPATRGRRGRSRTQGFRVRVRASVQMLQNGRQVGNARRRDRATTTTTAAFELASTAPAPTSTTTTTAQSTTIGAAVVSVSA